MIIFLQVFLHMHGECKISFYIFTATSYQPPLKILLRFKTQIYELKRETRYILNYFYLFTLK